MIGEAISWLERLRVHLMIRITQFTQVSSIVSRGTYIERNTVVFLKAPRFTVTFSLYLEALDNETLQRKIFQIRLKFQNTTITCKDSRILIFCTDSLIFMKNKKNKTKQNKSKQKKAKQTKLVIYLYKQNINEKKIKKYTNNSQKLRDL